jgi:FKBP-type peptidyl-prolyl cis-trans isomerase FkpA/FKBP-type peptidyl-prolyl cis-trans isomerase FklB
MKKTLLSALIATSVSFAYADNHAPLDTKEARLGYSIGSMFGGRMSQDFDNLDIEAFVKGFSDAYTGKELVMTQEEIGQAIQAFQAEQMAAAQAEQAKISEEAKAAGEAWLSEQAQMADIVTTESGLMYKAITIGEGAKPAATDVVKVNYEGSLPDGTVFDSSYERGEPISFPLDQVIPGWTEGLQQMPVGSKFELYIPSDLAYGPGGTGPIPPHSPLKFVVELLEIEATEATETATE